MARKLYLARHGNRMDAVDPSWVRRTSRPFDPGLSPDGIVQAMKLAQRLREERVAHVFSSPFLRAVETACQAAKLLGVPVKIEHGLSEWLNPEIYRAPPQWLASDVLARELAPIDTVYESIVHPHYPETEEDARARAGVVARMLVERFSGNLLLVGHGDSIVGAAGGLVPELPGIRCGLCGLVTLVHGGSSWTVELPGDHSHLEHPLPGTAL